jgi:hypothetical protein
MNRLHNFLIVLILTDEQTRHPYQDVENVTIVNVKDTEHHDETIYVVEYKFDVISRLDRKWRLNEKSGTKMFNDKELQPYFRDIRIDQILE